MRQIEEMSYREREQEDRLREMDNERDGFLREIEELEKVVKGLPKEELQTLAEELESVKEQLESEKRQGSKLKEGMQHSMDRLLHDKNYLQMDYNTMKT